MKRYDDIVQVTANRRITRHLWVLSFAHLRLARVIQPGQFLQIQVTDSEIFDPFLRRPFTIYRVRGSHIEILYEIVGKGTQILAEKKCGDRLKVMGPLGNSFTLKKAGRKGDRLMLQPVPFSAVRTVPQKRIVVGGGVGIAPFIFLGARARIDHFVMGARSREGLLPPSEIGRLARKIHFATEDGSYGDKGFVTVPLKKILDEEGKRSQPFLYICGPHAMMKAVAEMARDYGVEGEASLDERMACGIGACLGCVVMTKQGYRTSCVEGTVFPLEEVVW